MDATIRNLDEDAYRSLKAWAAYRGQTVGQALSELIRANVGSFQRPDRRGTLANLPTFKLPPGNERLSEEIDKVVYGT